MNRILVWVFILQFATGHNLLAELARMPLLLDHYQTHREEAPDLSFGRFLWMHYLENAHSHRDNSHAQLPLHCAHGPVVDSLVPGHLFPEFQNEPPPAQTGSHAFGDETLLPSDYSFGLLRPPIA
jgi:hypothetical protein